MNKVQKKKKKKRRHNLCTHRHGDKHTKLKEHNCLKLDCIT